MNIVHTASAYYACLLNIINMIRNTDYTILSVLVKTCT